MDVCSKVKLRDVTVYCNCSEPPSENLEEDDYNFLNYKELYFEPSADSDHKIDAFWKYLNYQNVPLPRVSRPKIHKRKKHVRVDEVLKQNEEYKSTNWAEKLAHFEEKGFTKMLNMSKRKTCTFCKNEAFDPIFADLTCRDIVRHLPDLIENKNEIKCEIDIKKSASIIVPEIIINKTNPVPQQETKLSVKSIPQAKSFSDITQYSNSLFADITALPRLQSHQINWATKSELSHISHTPSKHTRYTGSYRELGYHKSLVHRRKKLIFGAALVEQKRSSRAVASQHSDACISKANIDANIGEF